LDSESEKKGGGKSLPVKEEEANRSGFGIENFKIISVATLLKVRSGWMKKEYRKGFGTRQGGVLCGK